MERGDHHALAKIELVRLLAVRSLAKIAGPQAVELMKSALRDRDEDVRMAALKMLEKRGVQP